MPHPVYPRVRVSVRALAMHHAGVIGPARAAARERDAVRLGRGWNGDREEERAREGGWRQVE